MSETAARQCDRVLSAVPYRPRVLSLPWELRLPIVEAPCPGAPSPAHAKEQAVLPEAKGAAETAAPGTPKRSSGRID